MNKLLTNASDLIFGRKSFITGVLMREWADMGEKGIDI